MKDIPFKDTWHETLIKRIVREAAEKGYDGVSIGTGEQIWKALQEPGGSLSGMVQHYGTSLNPSQIGEMVINDLKEHVSHHISSLTRYGTNELNVGMDTAINQLTEFGGLTKQQAKAVLGHISAEEYGRMISENPKFPKYLKKYAKQYGIEAEMQSAYQIPTPEIIDRSHPWVNELTDSMYHKWNEAIANKDQKTMDKIWRMFGPNKVKATVMHLNDRLREQVLHRGQPLMNIAAPLAAGGGSALLAALYGQNQQA